MLGHPQADLHFLWQSRVEKQAPSTRHPPQHPVSPGSSVGAVLTVRERQDRMNTRVQLGETLQQRGIVLDLQSCRASSATQSTRRVHVTATSRQAVSMDLDREQRIMSTAVSVSQGNLHTFPCDSSEKHPEGCLFVGVSLYTLSKTCSFSLDS